MSLNPRNLPSTPSKQTLRRECKVKSTFPLPSLLFRRAEDDETKTTTTKRRAKFIVDDDGLSCGLAFVLRPSSSLHLPGCFGKRKKLSPSQSPSERWESQLMYFFSLFCCKWCKTSSVKVFVWESPDIICSVYSRYVIYTSSISNKNDID